MPIEMSDPPVFDLPKTLTDCGLSSKLFFFNLPPGFEIEDIKCFLSNHGPRPREIKIFSNQRLASTSGLIEYDSESEAIQSLIICNHRKISKQGVNGIIKLNFIARR